MPTNTIIFEDKLHEIDRLLRIKKGKWQLKARCDIDYEDVEQIIRIHIFKKWHLWNQEAPFGPWAGRIIQNQMRNLLRNLYSGFSRPCLKCAANEGGDLCSLYKTQCSECPLFEKWVKSKKQAHDIKIPLPLENHYQEAEQLHESFINYEPQIAIIHTRMKARLSSIQFSVYKMLYIDNLSDGEVAFKMGYKAKEDLKRKEPRYKQLENYKKMFLLVAQKILAEEDIV